VFTFHGRKKGHRENKPFICLQPIKQGRGGGGGEHSICRWRKEKKADALQWRKTEEKKKKRKEGTSPCILSVGRERESPNPIAVWKKKNQVKTFTRHRKESGEERDKKTPTMPRGGESTSVKKECWRKQG